MTPKQVELVQSSWIKVLPIADQAASLFYGRLFEIAPGVKPLFKSDIAEQGKKLMQMINTVVSSLGNLGSVMPAIETLAVRHVDYGVKDEHYDAVGSALLWTLEKGLGQGFTADVKAAWAETYSTLAGVMKNAAAKAAAVT